MTHIITCYLCHSRDYLEQIPEVGTWFCKCLKKDEYAKIGKKFWQCGMCYRAYYIDNSDMIPKCPICSPNPKVTVHGWVKDLPTDLKRDEFVHQPSLAELTKKLKTEVAKN